MEEKQYRKYVGKLNWLAQSTRPDLCFTSLSLAKRNAVSMIADLKGVNGFLKKVKERPSEMFYRRIGNKENLEVIRIEDASYKVDEFAIGGNLIFLKEKGSTRASLV